MTVTGQHWVRLTSGMWPVTVTLDTGKPCSVQPQMRAYSAGPASEVAHYTRTKSVVVTELTIEALNFKR